LNRDAPRTNLPAYTENTITDPEVLAAELRAIRASGWAESISERDAGTASISAPVFDHTGAMAAAIGIGCPVQRFNSTVRPTWTEAVVTGARRLSAALGHHERSTRK
jgi:IclR family transcriptional regulator, acetate operon repressor